MRRLSEVFVYVAVLGFLAFCAYAFFVQGSEIFGVIGAGVAVILGVNPVKKIRRRAKRETKDLLDTGGIGAVRDDSDERLRRRR